MTIALVKEDKELLPVEASRLRVRGGMALTASGAAIAAALCSLWATNHDTVIFFTAGLRHLAGQMPYGDFNIPQGPVAGLVAAFFLGLTPTVGYGIVVSSAVLNALASVVVWKIVARATRSQRYGCFAGVLTAIWFIPVMGSYYCDHLAYFFVLLAYLCYGRSPSRLALGTTAALLALAYHTKQPVGLMGLAAMAVVRLCDRDKGARPGRADFTLIGAYVLSHAAVLGLIGLVGNLENYLFYAVQAPLDFAFVQGRKDLSGLLSFFLLPWGVKPLQMISDMGIGRMTFYPLVLAAYASYALIGRTWWRGRSAPDRNMAPVLAMGFLLLSTIWCGALLGRYHGQLFFGFGGVIALGLFLMRRQGSRLADRFEIAAVCFFAVLGIVQIRVGGPGRMMLQAPNHFFSGTDLYPLQIEANAVTEANQQAIEFLKDKPGSIAILTGSAYLVPLALRRAPSNPSLYYEASLTVPSGPSGWARWEKDLIWAVEHKRPMFVLVGNGWLRWSDTFEKAVGYLKENYNEVFSGTRYKILQRHAP